MTALRSAVTTLRTSSARHRAQRSARRRLEHDLAQYRTPAERQDLYAVLARHSVEQVAPVDRILVRQARPAAQVHHSAR